MKKIEAGIASNEAVATSGQSKVITIAANDSVVAGASVNHIVPVTAEDRGARS